MQLPVQKVSELLMARNQRWKSKSEALLCIFLIYEDGNWRKHLGHQIQPIAVTDNNAIKLLKNAHRSSDLQYCYVSDVLNSTSDIQQYIWCTDLMYFSTCYQKFKINNDRPKIILCNGKNTDAITGTSSPTSLQYEELKKQKQKKTLRIKTPNPSRWTQKAGLVYAATVAIKSQVASVLE